MVNEKDFIIKTRSNGANEKRYKAICDKCNKDRGYIEKSKGDRLCRSCTRKGIHASWSPEKKKEIGIKSTKHFLGSKPWNKGKMNIYSDSLLEQWSEKHTTISSDTEYRKKMSCAKRSILLEDFKEFSTTVQERERAQIRSQGLTRECFVRDDYTCQVCLKRGIKLNAHHKNAFSAFPKQRFDLNNLVTLCESCHDGFHQEFGKGQNTEEQFSAYTLYK